MFSSVIIACENNSLSVVCLLTFAVQCVIKSWSFRVKVTKSFALHKKGENYLHYFEWYGQQNSDDVLLLTDHRRLLILFA